MLDRCTIPACLVLFLLFGCESRPRATTPNTISRGTTNAGVLPTLIQCGKYHILFPAYRVDDHDFRMLVSEVRENGTSGGLTVMGDCTGGTINIAVRNGPLGCLTPGAVGSPWRKVLLSNVQDNQLPATRVTIRDMQSGAEYAAALPAKEQFAPVRLVGKEHDAIGESVGKSVSCSIKIEHRATLASFFSRKAPPTEIANVTMCSHLAAPPGTAICGDLLIYDHRGVLAAMAHTSLTGPWAAPRERETPVVICFVEASQPVPPFRVEFVGTIAEGAWDFAAHDLWVGRVVLENTTSCDLD